MSGKVQEAVVKRWGINAIVLLGLLLLWRTQTYLLFHTVIELVSLYLATSLYLIGAQTYRYSKNQVLLCISIAFVYVGLFDLLHTLTIGEWLLPHGGLPTCPPSLGCGKDDANNGPVFHIGASPLEIVTIYN